MSTDNQRYSLEQQAMQIGKYAELHGYTIVHSYEDAGKSGMTVTGRAGLQRLLSDVMAGADFETILVLDVSRWGRFQDPDQAAHYEFLCKDAGVNIEYCAESFDNNDHTTSALLKGVKRVMAAEYSRQLSDRCRAGLKRTILAGGASGGQAPYGFLRQIFECDGTPGPVLNHGERRSRVDQTVRIVRGGKAEAVVIRRIFRQFLDDEISIRAIVADLNQRGVDYCRPGLWTESRVKAVLTNERVIGVRTFAKSHARLGEPSKPVPRSDWSRQVFCSPIISPKAFRRVLARLDAFAIGKLRDEEIIAQLRELAATKGRVSRRLIDLCPDLPSVTCVKRRLGPMSYIHSLIGDRKGPIRRSKRKREDLEPATIERRLAELLREKGYLSIKLIEADPSTPCTATLRKRYGSMTAVYALVGYSPSSGDAWSATWKRRRNKIYRKLDSANLVGP